MKKLLLILALTTTTAYAGEPTTDDVKHPFIANGGFHGLCDRLDWTWGDHGTNKACFSDAYAKRNGYVLVAGNWMQQSNHRE